jgi:DNA processing protein
MQTSVAMRNSQRRYSRYTPPPGSELIKVSELLDFCNREIGPTQKALFKNTSDDSQSVFYSGNISLLKRRCVSVIGARSASAEGLRRARKIAFQLAEAGVVVTSGLAKGVDHAAHLGAIEAGGATVAVIGTPLDKAYPAEHSELQEEIYSNHLLISQFASGTRTFPSDFPKRNRLMAAVTDASIIVEASDSSGTLHQASECIRLKRWLFIMKSVAESPDLDWPAKFLREDRVAVLTTVDDVIDRIGGFA